MNNTEIKILTLLRNTKFAPLQPELELVSFHIYHLAGRQGMQMLLPENINKFYIIKHSFKIKFECQEIKKNLQPPFFKSVRTKVV